MANSLRNYSFPGVGQVLTIPLGSTDSNIFTIHEIPHSVMVQIPATMTGTSVKLQKMLWRADLEAGAEVFADLWTFDSGAGTVIQLNVVAADFGKAIQINGDDIGSGVFKFVSQAAEAAARSLNLFITRMG